MSNDSAPTFDQVVEPPKLGRGRCAICGGTYVEHSPDDDMSCLFDSTKYRRMTDEEFAVYQNKIWKALRELSSEFLADALSTPSLIRQLFPLDPEES